MMITNIAESMNTLLKEGWTIPVLSLLNYIRMILQGWFFERREATEKILTPLTSQANAKIEKCIVKSHRMLVSLADRYVYEVRGGDNVEIVNIREKTCTCMKFDLEQLSCAHALAVCSQAIIKRSRLQSQKYTTDAFRSAYGETIHPVGDQSD